MKTLRWSWPVFAFAVLFLVPWSCHALKPERELGVVVLDKTVPFENRIEHRSLFWLLNHLKIVQPAGMPYDTHRDYLGAFPGPTPGDPPQRTRDLELPDVARADLLYIADTYGVYEEDLESGADMLAALERSPKIYGGLTAREADVAARALQEGKTLVVEFNTMASPTGSKARRTMERILGVRWTRWLGRYFTRMEEKKEVPQWLRDNYEREWKRPWDFEGPGYVLVKDDDHVEVLRSGMEAERVGLTLEREEPVDALLGSAHDHVPYSFWFSIMQAGDGTEVLARFDWHLEETGRDRLAARGLPLSFPAVCRRLEPGGGTAYYFAGDFADNPMPETPVPLVGYRTAKKWFEAARLAPSEAAFYWRFYVPMMSRLLEEVPDGS